MSYVTTHLKKIPTGYMILAGLSFGLLLFYLYMNGVQPIAGWITPIITVISSFTASIIPFLHSALNGVASSFQANPMAFLIGAIPTAIGFLGILSKLKNKWASANQKEREEKEIAQKAVTDTAVKLNEVEAKLQMYEDKFSKYEGFEQLSNEKDNLLQLKDEALRKANNQIEALNTAILQMKLDKGEVITKTQVL